MNFAFYTLVHYLTTILNNIIFYSYEHKKNDSISSNCSSKSYYGLSDDGLQSPNNSLDKQVKFLE